MAENLEQITKLRQDFEEAVSGYVTAFLKQFELDERDCWWVGERIGLDNFCFGDIYAISLEDMVFCVENNVTYDEFVAHTEYWIKCDEYNLPKMNLQSWHKGAPRIPQSTFDNLDKLKKNLKDAIEQAKEQY